MRKICIRLTAALFFGNRFCFFFGALGFSLKLRHWSDLVFREMRDMIAFGSMRLFGIGPAHTGFCHDNHLGYRITIGRKVMPAATVFMRHIKRILRLGGILAGK